MKVPTKSPRFPKLQAGAAPKPIPPKVPRQRFTKQSQVLSKWKFLRCSQGFRYCFWQGVLGGNFVTVGFDPILHGTVSDRVCCSRFSRFPWIQIPTHFPSMGAPQKNDSGKVPKLHSTGSHKASKSRFSTKNKCKGSKVNVGKLPAQVPTRFLREGLQVKVYK